MFRNFSIGESIQTEQPREEFSEVVPIQINKIIVIIINTIYNNQSNQ